MPARWPGPDVASLRYLLVAGGQVPRRFAGCPSRDSVSVNGPVAGGTATCADKIRLCPLHVACGRSVPSQSLPGIPHTFLPTRQSAS